MPEMLAFIDCDHLWLHFAGGVVAESYRLGYQHWMELLPVEPATELRSGVLSLLWDATFRLISAVLCYLGRYCRQSLPLMYSHPVTTLATDTRTLLSRGVLSGIE